jgi:hypothetical protein
MMGAALRGLISQPSNSVSNRHVIEWVNWMLALSPGSSLEAR